MLRLRQSKRTLLVTLAASAMVAASSAYAGTAAPALSATAPAHRADRDARSAAAGRILAAGKVQGFQQGATIMRPGIR